MSLPAQDYAAKAVAPVPAPHRRLPRELTPCSARLIEHMPRPTYIVALGEGPGIPMQVAGQEGPLGTIWAAHHVTRPCRSTRAPCLHVELACLAGELAECRHQAATYGALHRGPDGPPLAPPLALRRRMRRLERDLARAGFVLEVL